MTFSFHSCKNSSLCYFLCIKKKKSLPTVAANKVIDSTGINIIILEKVGLCQNEIGQVTIQGRKRNKFYCDYPSSSLTTPVYKWKNVFRASLSNQIAKALTRSLTFIRNTLPGNQWSTSRSIKWFLFWITARSNLTSILEYLRYTQYFFFKH